jgi:cation diffusion facilitator CzcD-associated flavoprotein CzcO
VPVVLSEHFHYKDCMVSNLPNFVQVFGYLNASWTLRVDLVAAFTVQVLTHMARTGTQVVTPVLPETTIWSKTPTRRSPRAICGADWG